MTSESVAINSRRASGSTMPPDYEVFFSGSDWARSTFWLPGPNLRDALHSGEDHHSDPELDLEAES